MCIAGACLTRMIGDPYIGDCKANWRSNIHRSSTGGVAQLVEQRNHNPRVGGSSPSSATNKINNLWENRAVRILCLSAKVTPKVTIEFYFLSRSASCIGR